MNEAHIQELNRIVSAYLDLAENNAQRGIAFTMEHWVRFLDNFLQLSEYPLLTNKGKVSMLEAKLKAEQEYDLFRVTQDKLYESDFDKAIKNELTQKRFWHLCKLLNPRNGISWCSSTKAKQKASL